MKNINILRDSISGHASTLKQLNDMSAKSTLTQLTDSMTGKTSLADTMKKINALNSIDNLQSSIIHRNSLGSIVRSLEIKNSLTQLQRSMMTNTSLSSIVESIQKNSQLSHLQRSVMAATGSLPDVVQGIKENSILSQLQRSVMASSSLAETIQSLQTKNSLTGITKSLITNTSFFENLNTLGGHSSLQKLANSISASSGLSGTLEHLIKNDYFSSFLEDLEKETFNENLDIDVEMSLPNKQATEEFLTDLASAKTLNDFSAILENTPSFLKFILLKIFLLFIFPILIGAAGGVAGNLATPYVQSYLAENKTTSQREKIKNIKKLSFSEIGIELIGYRFITTNKLHLRSTPNARAPSIAELSFGQVVGVLSSSRDWTEVVYQYGDGTEIQGWVFTRYTAKFRR